MTNDVPLLAFYHLSLINDWERIFKEMMTDVIDSGLYDAIEAIHIGVIDSPTKPDYLPQNRWKHDTEYYNKLLQLIQPYDKFKILYRKTELGDERVTFNILYDLCVQWSAEYPIPGYEQCKKKILYFHSKGVTHDSNPRMDGWRDTMQKFVICNWQVAIEKLNTYDSVGCLMVDVNKHKFTNHDNTQQMSYPLHYTGGYWWANSDYIAKISYPASARHAPGRTGPEGYICSASPAEKHFSLFDTPGKLPEQAQVFLPDRYLWKLIKESEYL